MTGALPFGGARIVGAGARTPLGVTATHLAMAVRAGLSLQGEVPMPPFEEAVPVALMPDLPPSLTGAQRLAALARPSLEEACRGLEPPDGGFPIVIAAPAATRPDVDAFEVRELVALIASELPIDTRNAIVIAEGPCAGPKALLRALAWLERGHPAVAVGGVDSFAHPAVVSWLANQGVWEPGSRPERHFAEGAAFVVLERAPKTASAAVLEHAAAAAIPDGITISPRDTPVPLRSIGRARRRASIRRLGFEPSYPMGPRADRHSEVNDTLTALVEEALRTADVSSCIAYTDADHAPIRMAEWSEVAVRALPRGCRIDHFTRTTGDVGAANALLLAAIWTRWAEAGCAPAGLGIVGVHDLERGRGVVTLRATTFAGGASL